MCNLCATVLSGYLTYLRTQDFPLNIGPSFADLGWVFFTLVA